MILTKQLIIEIKNKRQIEYYDSKGFYVKNGDMLNVDISILPSGSHLVIETKCDNCGEIKKNTI